MFQDTAIFVVNLEDRIDKWQTSSGILTEAGLTATRVLAVDGRGRTPESFPDYDADAVYRFFGRPMTGAEVGCYLSHMSVLERFLETDARFALVLEDDFEPVFEDSFAATEAILDVLRGKPAGYCDIVNLGNYPRRPRKLEFAVTVGGEDTLISRAGYFPLGAFSLIFTRDGARALLNRFDKIIAPYDHVFRLWASETYGGLALSRPLFTYSAAPSDLSAGRKYKKDLYYVIAESRRQALIRTRSLRHWLLGR